MTPQLSEDERARFERAWQSLKAHPCIADDVRMTNPEPPSNPTPERPLAPAPTLIDRVGNKLPWIVGTLAIAAALTVYAGSRYDAAPEQSCVMTAEGNTLCGDDAIARCEMQFKRDQLADPDTYDACIHAGWGGIR